MVSGLLGRLARRCSLDHYSSFNLADVLMFANRRLFSVSRDRHKITSLLSQRPSFELSVQVVSPRAVLNFYWYCR